jgi:CRP/FNR family transcriptional regulator, polysaccharide utilization system transcription regulator
LKPGINIENILGCFQSLEKEDIEFLNENKTQVAYYKGDTIFKQGAFTPHVLFVNSGLVTVTLQTGREKQINIRLVKQGDFISFSSIFNNDTYKYSAISQTDSTICMIEKEALRKLLIKNPKFAMQIISRNSNNEKRYLEIIKNVSYKQMRGKLASAILYLSSEEFLEEDVFNFLSRQDIADFASITVESAVKFLKEFEKEGILSLDGRRVIIKNHQALGELDLRG